MNLLCFEGLGRRLAFSYLLFYRLTNGGGTGHPRGECLRQGSDIAAEDGGELASQTLSHFGQR